MKSCPNCGFRNDDKAWNCSRCKTDIRQQSFNAGNISYGGSNGNTSLNGILLENNRQNVKIKGFIEITKHTVTLENDVFQFRNVTGFGISDVKTKGVPLVFIFVLFLLAIFSGSNPDLSSWTLLLGIILTGAVAYNIARPKLYGLSVYLNSGNEVVFVTQDMDFLKRVVRTLKEFMESPQEGKYINITVGGDNKSNIVIGDVDGSILSK